MDKRVQGCLSTLYPVPEATTLRFKAVVPNLFGTWDQFHGRQFAMDGGGWGGQEEKIRG